jgi:hypothetical protein
MWLHGLIVLSEYLVITNVISEKLLTPTLGYTSPPYFQIIFEIHEWNSTPFQGFQNHFSKTHLSVPDLEFLLHYKVFQRS